MTRLDWTVLVTTILVIVTYGLWKTRHVVSAEAYLRGGSDLKWYTIGLSIMATQASAITFLSTPGQAYEDGMGFVQFYFGLPLAMVILSATIVPLYHKLKVYTAYQYLEGRFDQKTRQLTAFLFLLQRGLGAGLSIYAPAIILSSVLHWPLHLTNLLIGTIVVLYTVSGGTRAVSQTQTLQMVVMLGGMAVALGFVLYALPPKVSFSQALHIAGTLGHMKAVDFSPRFDTRYTFWSGMTGGLFVALAYFGTDQSQVQRYLTGSSLKESRLGLLFNGLVKVPMQLFILTVGLMVFVFYQFNKPPVFFHDAELTRARQSIQGPRLKELEVSYDRAFEDKRLAIDRMVEADRASDGSASEKAGDEARAADAKSLAIRGQVKELIAKAHKGAETKDADYVFITFVTQRLPSGLVGILLAVILCAAMSSSASALNALGSTSVIDFYKRSVKPDASDAHYLLAAKGFTVLWGLVAVTFATFASLLDNLIQAVNILGSIFYGPTLGVFLVGFFFKRIRGTAVFIALCISQLAVILTFALSSIGFLWYNVIGCALVVALATLFQLVIPDNKEHANVIS